MDHPSSSLLGLILRIPGSAEYDCEFRRGRIPAPRGNSTHHCPTGARQCGIGNFSNVLQETYLRQIPSTASWSPTTALVMNRTPIFRTTHYVPIARKSNTSRTSQILQGAETRVEDIPHNAAKPALVLLLRKSGVHGAILYHCLVEDLYKSGKFGRVHRLKKPREQHIHVAY
jgi:hypothetical protein